MVETILSLSIFGFILVWHRAYMIWSDDVQHDKLMGCICHHYRWLPVIEVNEDCLLHGEAIKRIRKEAERIRYGRFEGSERVCNSEGENIT